MIASSGYIKLFEHHQLFVSGPRDLPVITYYVILTSKPASGLEVSRILM